jgi:riboflavin biosynthesis pyrimidine reductase
MLLEHKVAVIYGAGGPIGGAVARAFAREGASVFLAGRTKAKLDTVADDIRAQGGLAHTAVVDALDVQAVAAYILSGNASEEITNLKRQNGKNIVVTGSAELAQSLMQHNLIDEYRLFLTPVVVGRGKRLFTDGIDAQTLQHVETKTFNSGVVLLIYKPTQRV